MKSFSAPTTGANVHKLNKCGKCEAEPVNGSCDSDDCKTSKEDLKKAFPNAPNAVLETLTELLNTYAKQFGIDTQEKLQHFLTQAGQETGGFNTLSVTEDLKNYSSNRLMEVWPSRFSQTDPTKLDPDNSLIMEQNWENLFMVVEMETITMVMDTCIEEEELYK